MLPSCLAALSLQDLKTSLVLVLKTRCKTDSDSEAIAPHLSQNTALRQLYIGYNDFGDQGATYLCQALSNMEGGWLSPAGRHPYASNLFWLASAR